MTRRFLERFALVAFGTLMLVPTASAQPTRVAGRVVIAGDSVHSIESAEVALLPTLRAVRTDLVGRFAFEGVDAGMYTLRVRRVGFEIALQAVNVRNGPADSVIVSLTAAPDVLQEVVISGRRTLFPARLADAYARVAHGGGDYFTREQIDSLRPYDVKSLMSLIPGVFENDRGIEFHRCLMISGMVPPQVYIDGKRMTNRNARGAAAEMFSVNEVLRTVPIPSIQLIEVYRGVSRIPAEFLDDACAVIAIWTR